MTEYQFNDLIEDEEGTLWRCGGDGPDAFWYPQTEQQDGYEELEDIPGPHTPMVLITKEEYAELLELAARYLDLCR